MNTQSFLVKRCEEMVQTAYKGLSDKYEHLPHEETIILLVFRKIVEKADALNVLMENQCGRVTDSFARELLESYWHFLYLLEEDTNFRTLSYYYFDKRQKSLNVLAHIEYMEKSGKLIKDNSVDITKIEHRDVINYLDNDGLFQEVRDEISKKRDNYVKWYSLKNNNNSIKKLALHLGKIDEYDSSYALFSGEVHGLTGTSHIDTKNDKAFIKPLRSKASGEGRQAFCQYYLSMSIEKFVEYFRLDEDYKKLRKEMAERVQRDRLKDQKKHEQQRQKKDRELNEFMENLIKNVNAREGKNS